MRARRSEQFICRDFELYDSGIIPVVGPMVLNVYEVLRRLVWRSDERGTSTSRRMFSEGLLAVVTKQSEVGEYLRISRQTTNKYIKTIVDLGWVRQQDVEEGTAYVLGERVTDSNGDRHEVFYADAWMKATWEALDAAVKDRGRGERVTDLPLRERIALVEKLLDSSDLSQKIRQPLSNSPTPPVKPALHPLSSWLDTPCQPSLTAPPSGNGASSGDNSEISGMVPAINRERNREGNREEEIGGELRSPHNFSTQGRIVDLEKIEEAAKAKSRRSHEKQLQKARVREEKRKNLGGTRSGDVARLEKVWRQEMLERSPDIVVARWFTGKASKRRAGKEAGQAQQLLDKYGYGIVEDAFRYLVRRWDEIRSRFFKGKGVAPAVGVLLKFHDSLVLESQKWSELSGVESEWKAWLKANPDNPYPPKELDSRYKKAKRELEALSK